MACQYRSGGQYVPLNTCGYLCGGGVVSVSARQTGGNGSGAAPAGGCQACPAAFATGHSVQSCPANTRLRGAASAGCPCCTGCAASAGCNGDCTGCRCRSNVTGSTAGAGCSCGATAANATANGVCPADEGVGMVYAVSQTLNDVYDSESALRTGTLFPGLHKPMNGRCPGSCNCSTEDQQTAFAAWDLRLYLDTHPEDTKALALFQQLCQEAGQDSYATAFLPGRSADWNWTDDPWPWECRPCNT